MCIFSFTKKFKNIKYRHYCLVQKKLFVYPCVLFGLCFWVFFVQKFLLERKLLRVWLRKWFSFFLCLLYSPVLTLEKKSRLSFQQRFKTVPKLFSIWLGKFVSSFFFFFVSSRFVWCIFLLPKDCFAISLCPKRIFSILLKEYKFA